MPIQLLRGKRALNQPALTISMEDIIDRSYRVTNTTPNVTYALDPDLKKIVDSWPKGSNSTRAPSSASSPTRVSRTS